MTLDATIEAAINQGVFPGASLLVSTGNKILHQKVYGHAQLIPQKIKLTDQHLFDIASLTKPMATAMLFMLGFQEGSIDLDDTLGQFFPATKLKDISLRQLLNHTSGLPAWKPYFEKLILVSPGWIADSHGKGKQWLLDQILLEKPETPPGARTVYSDLGYILLGKILEIVLGKTLDILFEERIAQKLGLNSTFYNPVGANNHSPLPDTTLFAATEDCPWREQVLNGEVEDDHAYVMGGIAGHAGLFSTATDIWKWLRELAKANKGTSTFIQQKTFEEFCSIPEKRDLKMPYFTLGFDTPSEPSSSGTHFSTQSLGHLGYSGCSFWWDLEKDATIILLTNRVHPTRDNEQIKAFRPRLHDLIWEEFIK